MKIDSSWTLFLDRDGVINRRIPGGYITQWEEFEFLPGTLEALKKLSSLFGRIIVVSNQQGVGKGIMTEKDLDHIHRKMISEINKNGGRIDRIYHSPYLETENSRFRKPNTGMADQAHKDFPEIDFKQAVMAGDSISDMHFGKRKNMRTVFIGSSSEHSELPGSLADYFYPDLLSFAHSLTA